MATQAKKPNFFVVGAPKAGTSALYAFLDQHPQIFMSPLKEPNYFASEMRPEHFGRHDRGRLAAEMQALDQYLHGDMKDKRFGGMVSTWEDYLLLFRNATDQVAVGEATACYLWSRSAPHAIAERVPDARIIVNLRDPADRAFSQYLQMVSAGRTRLSFRAQINESMRCDPQQFGRSWPLLEFGLYHQQLSRYLNEFPRSQIHISLYEDLQRDPARLMSELFAFLGVEPAHAVDVAGRHHEPVVPRMSSTAYLLKKARLWGYLRNLAPRPLGPRMRSLLVRPRASLVMEPDDREFLVEYYREEIGSLALLLGRNLDAWLDPSRR